MANKDTWPGGGALWDIGVLLVKVIVMVNNSIPCSSVAARNELHVNRLEELGLWPKSWKDRHILELGCDVGLTDLVAASLGAKLSLLTDREVVVNNVTCVKMQY